MALFVIYLAATQERQNVNEVAATVQEYTAGKGGDLLTYAEELRLEGRTEGRKEGRREGEIRGKVEMIESLLAVGADWSLITRATAITPEEFQKLKEQLRHFNDAQTDDEPAAPTA